ncbi:hypothetical protein [Streptomyces sp. NPDC054901]
MKKIKAAILAFAAVAGLAVAAAPAQAAPCSTGGAQYICEYGVTNHALPGDQREQFLVGTDYAVWTRWTTNGKWSGWYSLGGTVWSKISIREQTDIGPHAIWIYAKGSNTQTWGLLRTAPGANWSAWDCLGCADR